MVQGLSMVTLHWLDNFFFQVPPHYTSQPLHIDRACRRVASQYSWGHILLISHSTLPLSCIFETPFYRALPKTQHSLWSLGFFLTLTAFVFLCHFFSGHSHLTSAVIGGWSIRSEMTGCDIGVTIVVVMQRGSDCQLCLDQSLKVVPPDVFIHHIRV